MGSCFGCFFLFCFRSWGVGRGRDLDLSGRKPSLHQALVPSVYINCACGGLTKRLRCRTRDQEVAGLNPVYGGLSQCCPNTIWWEIIFSTPPSTCPPHPSPIPIFVSGWWAEYLVLWVRQRNQDCICCPACACLRPYGSLKQKRRKKAVLGMFHRG